MIRFVISAALSEIIKQAFPLPQPVSMASMIERECRIPDERPVIAGVINNRLKDDMPLQIDSTVLYPITDGMYDRQEVTYDDLEVDSPYLSSHYKCDKL